MFTEGLEPDDHEAPIWRFMDFWKFKDLMESSELYFRRSDKLRDEHEGLPPEEFAKAFPSASIDTTSETTKS